MPKPALGPGEAESVRRQNERNGGRGGYRGGRGGGRGGDRGGFNDRRSNDNLRGDYQNGGGKFCCPL
jgi:hypothetical protein